ncbi:hypothetical protein PCC7424_2405 [uncultured phage MedDCM-OCT-S04-C348]|nr:hypothetical protein PCC7424_2405 [uncultured phage MedDCM-OCT-S04-C348]
MVVEKKSKTVKDIFKENPSVFEELNKKPARITINGKRHYETPFWSGPAPSVTTIISETASEANKKKLEMWSKNNPGVKEAAAERGTAIHSCMEMFLKKEDVDVPPEYQEFWTGMPEILEQFDEVLWAETPLRDDHRFALSEDGIGRVWGRDEEERPWVGSPDIIGIAKGKLTLADLKTSTKPYCRWWPKDLEKGCPEWRDRLGGYMKFKKCLKQLGAYALGIEQTLNMKVDQAAIIVSTPKDTQLFKISRRHLNYAQDDWLKVVAEYYNQINNCVVYDADNI